MTQPPTRLGGLVRSARPIALIATGSSAGQVVAAVMSVLLIRWLSVPEYALYVIFAAAVATVNSLTNTGIGPALNSLIGRFLPDLTLSALVIKHARRARYALSAAMLPPVLAITYWLCYGNGAGTSSIIVVLVFLIISWIGDIQSRVIDQSLFHVGEATRVQTLDLALACARLATLWVAAQFDQVSLGMACGINAISALLRVFPIQYWCSKHFPEADVEVTASGRNAEIARVMRQMTIRQIPVEILVILQPQLVLWVITKYLDVLQLAQYGAVTRIAQIFVPITVLVSTLLIPRFARRRKALGRAFLLSLLVVTGPAIALTVLVGVASTPILALFGAEYRGLNEQLVIAAASAGLLVVAGTAWQLVVNRGHNRYAWVQIPITLGWALLFPQVHTIDDLTSVLFYQAGFAISLITACLLEFRSLFDEPQSRTAESADDAQPSREPGR